MQEPRQCKQLIQNSQTAQLKKWGMVYNNLAGYYKKSPTRGLDKRVIYSQDVGYGQFQIANPVSTA